MQTYNLRTPWGYYLADTGETWEGDYATALLLRWQLAKQGLGILEIVERKTNGNLHTNR